MNYELFIARRYLSARRKQALISIISGISAMGIMLGVAALIISLALMTGFREDIQGRILGANAHIIVKSYDAEDRLDHWEERILKIKAIDGIAAAAPSTYDKGVLTSKYDTKGSAAVVKGILPGRMAEVTRLRESITEGSFWNETPDPVSPPGIVLGKELAMDLGVGPGDRVTLVSPHMTLAPFGAIPRRRAFEVTGIFESGLYFYDTTWAYVSLASGQSLLSLDSAVSHIEVSVDDPDLADTLAKVIENRLGDVYTANWKEMNKPLLSAFKLEKILMFLAIGLIVLVASFNIITTLVLMVMEKNRDIAILKTMGASQASLRRIFVYQGFAVGLVGTALGTFLGTGTCYILETYRLIQLPSEVYLISYVPFHLKLLDVLLVVTVALAISLIATLYPSRQASGLDVVEGLKHE